MLPPKQQILKKDMTLGKKIFAVTPQVIYTEKSWQILNKDHFKMHVHLYLNPNFYEVTTDTFMVYQQHIIPQSITKPKQCWDFYSSDISIWKNT